MKLLKWTRKLVPKKYHWLLRSENRRTIEEQIAIKELAKEMNEQLDIFCRESPKIDLVSRK